MGFPCSNHGRIKVRPNRGRKDPLHKIYGHMCQHLPALLPNLLCQHLVEIKWSVGCSPRGDTQALTHSNIDLEDGYHMFSIPAM